MGNCSEHKKEVAGISDMKLLAEMIGDLHYETMAELFNELALKINEDGTKDWNNGRKKLGAPLLSAADYISHAADDIVQAWQISKPFMETKIENHGNMEYDKVVIEYDQLVRDILFMESVLPDTYTVKGSKIKKGSIHCFSPTGIYKLIKGFGGYDTGGFNKGMDIDDEELWQYILKRIKQHFGDRFQEVYHGCNFRHTDFIVYLKSVEK